MQIALVVGNEGIADAIFVAKQLRTESAISSLAQLALLIPLSRDDFMLLAVSTDSKPVAFFLNLPLIFRSNNCTKPSFFFFKEIFQFCWIEKERGGLLHLIQRRKPASCLL